MKMSLHIKQFLKYTAGYGLLKFVKNKTKTLITIQCENYNSTIMQLTVLYPYYLNYTEM